MSNNGVKIALSFLVGFFVFFFTALAMAQHGHGGMDMSSHGDMSKQGGMDMSSHGSSSHSMSMKDRPVQSVTVEGFKVTLDVMDMSMHASMQKMKGNPAPGESDHAKSHAIMVVVQDTASKEIITDVKVNYTIVSPSGEKETGKLDWSGDHYGRGFSPKEKGVYQVQLQIESGGMEREAKFSYNL
jgi:hypothetical protein